MEAAEKAVRRLHELMHDVDRGNFSGPTTLFGVPLDDFEGMLPGGIPVDEARQYAQAGEWLIGRCKELLTAGMRACEDVEKLYAADPKSLRRAAAVDSIHPRIQDLCQELDRGHWVAGEQMAVFEAAVNQPTNRYYTVSALLIHDYEEAAGRLAAVVGNISQVLSATCASIHRDIEAVIMRRAGLYLRQIDNLHHSAFEQHIADLLDRDGYRIVRSGGGAGDQGVDVLAVDELGNHLAVQAKHFTAGNGRVGQPVLQHLVGGNHPPRTLPIVVTNGAFVGGAKAWAAEGDRVRLIDREGLKRWSEAGMPLADVLRGPGPTR
ncbi:restriction endonuclease [Streptomyces sp. NPDC058157]|uniref:restriction endonuclease n=1 Tax=Streptomyces sp. NPDC058157 TaxID=3346360 RepID=UPI0036E199F3